MLALPPRSTVSQTGALYESPLSTKMHINIKWLGNAASWGEGGGGCNKKTNGRRWYGGALNLIVSYCPDRFEFSANFYWVVFFTNEFQCLYCLLPCFKRGYLLHADEIRFLNDVSLSLCVLTQTIDNYKWWEFVIKLNNSLLDELQSWLLTQYLNCWQLYHEMSLKI